MGRTVIGYRLAFARLVPPRRGFACFVLVASVACGGGSNSHSSDVNGGASNAGAGAGGGRASGGKANTSGASGGGARAAGTTGEGGVENAGESGAPDEGGGTGLGLGGRDGAGGNHLVPLGGFFSGGTGSGKGGVGGGGAPGAGGKGSGGAGVCVEGLPCSCSTLTGVTQCSALGSACSCPPAEQCTPLDTSAKCFEPCGGDPFGSWVLTDSCFRGQDSGLGCERSLIGTPGANDIRIRILDGGAMEMAGREHWSVEVQAAVACLGVKSINSCSNDRLYVEPTLFSAFTRLPCVGNACGICDCKGEVETFTAYETTDWRRRGTELDIGGRILPYCVQGDELWLGGGNYNGEPRAAYKFKKKSCVGTPLPCSARTVADCSVDGACNVGACKATGGSSATRCAMAYTEEQCGVLQGCAWDAAGCSGPGSTQCDIASCEKVPGCSWGEPVERCGGESLDCFSRNPTKGECLGGGCTLVDCQANQTDTVDCKQLTSAADCMKAPGCTVAESGTTVCTGVARCTAQTDLNICSKFYCQVSPACLGTAVHCSSLTVANCHDVPGCRLEW